LGEHRKPVTDQRVDISERRHPHAIVRHRARIILAGMADTTAATTATTPQPHARRGPEPPDIEEKGGMKEGKPQKLNQRLFSPLLGFGACANTPALAKAMADAGLAGVVYEDVNDPRGVALLTFNEEPGYFLDRVRPLLNREPFASLVQKPEYTML